MLKIEKIDIKKLKLSKINPRKINQNKYKKLVQSLTDFPKMLEIRPIVVDENMEVLGGNQRLKAAIECGIKEIPIIKASELTEQQKKEFIIKDNVSSGEWDIESLQVNFQGTNFSNWGLDFSFVQPDYSINNHESNYEEPDTDADDLDDYEDFEELDEYEKEEDNYVNGESEQLADYEQEDNAVALNETSSIVVEYRSQGEKDRLIKFLRQFNFKYKID